MATIKLYKSVPWSQGGFHVLRFNDSLRQAQYFAGLDSEVFEIDWEPRPGANLNVPISYLEAKQFNYLSYNFDNISTHDRYFFIEDYEYLNDNPTTRLIVSEDIWQNNHIDMTVAPGIVHRRHMPRWNGSTPILYPVDEGTCRSYKSSVIANLQDGRDLSGKATRNAIILCTSKRLETQGHEDGIYYYLAWNDISSHSRVPTPWTNKYWMDLTGSDMNSYFEKWGVGLAPIVSIYVIPYCTIGQNPAGDAPTFQSLYGEIVEPSDTSSNGVLFAVDNPFNGSNPVSISNPITKPTKNTAIGTLADIDYEPQAWSDNCIQYAITNNAGSSVITIPNDWAYRFPYIYVTNSVFSLSPVITFYFRESAGVVGTMADGMAINLPCVPVDIPQSQWADYVAQSQSADRQIMENNISNRYLTGTVGAITGAGSGYAYGAMYADSFNNSKRSPGKAGLAGAGMNLIAGVGSLVNAYIQSGTDRDNFKLNEQKIKNTPAPPIAGDNSSVMIQFGNNLIKMQGDSVSRNIIWNQYRYYGVIVDESMDIPLRTRRYYDYLQTRDATVIGPMTNEAKSYLEALLNRGVTIWHADSATIYDYQYDNVEWSG